MKQRKYYNHNGFTLVELIISLGIMGIITLTISSLFNYNLKTFAKSADSMNEQANLRLLSLNITNQLRNIGYIDLDNLAFADTSDIAAVSITDNFIFKGGNLVKKGDASGISDLADEVINDISFSLRNDGKKYFLGVKVTGKVHSYTTEVLLNNIITDNAIQLDSKDIGQSGFSSVRYNYNTPPPEFYEPPTTPTEVVNKPLDLIPPNPDTVKMGETFTYEANAVGGVPPYTYQISVVSYIGDVPPLVSINKITWISPSQKNKRLKFNVTVTDSNPDVGTISIQFTITTTE
jgi:prepilin-type N-terminal cleavage/methylation domain-containing protein